MFIIIITIFVVRLLSISSSFSFACARHVLEQKYYSPIQKTKWKAISHLPKILHIIIIIGQHVKNIRRSSTVACVTCDVNDRSRKGLSFRKSGGVIQKEKHRAFIGCYAHRLR